MGLAYNLAKSRVSLTHILFEDMTDKAQNVDGFEEGVKWIRLTTDIPTAAREIVKSKLNVRDYLRSYRGKKEFAVLSAKDPLPIIMELLLLPYLWIKKGF